MWLCIDQGGHSTRAAVFDRQGRLAADAAAPLATITRGAVNVEHDPAALLESVDRTVAEVASQLGRDAAGLEAAGIATQRSTLLCAERSSGAPLTPLISWQDRRGQDDLERFDAQAERVKQITGLRLSPHYGMGKLRWCLQHVDAVKEKAQQRDLIGAPLVTFILHHLCGGGRWLVDPVNASRTLLMDMRTAAWSGELTRLFELAPEMLPDIRPCRSRFGTMRVGAGNVPVTVATGDQAAAIYCLGDPPSGRAFVNIGTGAFVQAMTGARPISDSGLLSSIVWQDEISTQYVLEGTVNGAAAAIDAVSADLGRRLDPRGSELAEALCNIEAAPLFLNGVAGLGSPDWVADFPTRFEGSGSVAEQLAAVYESIAFLIVRNLGRMRQHLRLTSLTVSGGLGQMDWLAQRLADLCRLPVSRPVEAEATLTGVAYLVSRGAVTPRSAHVTFEPAANAAAERRYEGWTTAMEKVLSLQPDRT